jgi:hypothetical protein
MAVGIFIIVTLEIHLTPLINRSRTHSISTSAFIPSPTPTLQATTYIHEHEVHIPHHSSSGLTHPTANEVGPPWATSDAAKWSSVYNSLASAGRIPSTLTAAPWPTGSWGPGAGPWGPGGGRGSGGPGGHWGGTYLLIFSSHLPFEHTSHTSPRSLGRWSLWSVQLRALERLVYTL